MNSKKFKISLLVITLLIFNSIHVAFVYASTKKPSAKPATEQTVSHVSYNITTIEDAPTFEEFMGDSLEYISKEDRKKLEVIYGEIIALEASNDYELANAKWDKFYKIQERNLNVPKTFDEYIKDIRSELDPANLPQMETLYNAAVALEAAENFEAAGLKWSEFFMLQNSKINYTEDFDSFMKDINSDYSASQLKKLKKLYNKALKYERESNFESSKKAWDDFYDIIDSTIPVQ